MLKFAVKRILFMIPSIIIITLVTFVIMSFSAGSPGKVIGWENGGHNGQLLLVFHLAGHLRLRASGQQHGRQQNSQQHPCSFHSRSSKNENHLQIM